MTSGMLFGGMRFICAVAVNGNAAATASPPAVARNRRRLLQDRGSRTEDRGLRLLISQSSPHHTIVMP
jgi:hypothetical protein